MLTLGVNKMTRNKYKSNEESLKSHFFSIFVIMITFSVRLHLLPYLIFIFHSSILGTYTPTHTHTNCTKWFRRVNAFLMAFFAYAIHAIDINTSKRMYIQRTYINMNIWVFVGSFICLFMLPADFDVEHFICCRVFMGYPLVGVVHIGPMFRP